MDWSKLLYELLGEIAAKLNTIEDISSFSSVCRTWNQVGSMVKSNWTAKVPYLLLEEDGDEPNNPRRIFSVTRNKCHKLYIPEIFGARCWGSAYGWLVVFGLDFKLYLLNPLTKIKITFPPFPFRKLIEGSEEFDAEWLKTFAITKAFVMRDYENSDNFIVFAISYELTRCLYFARPSDKEWTNVKSPFKTLKQVYDVTWLGRYVFILYNFGSLGYFDITEVHNNKVPPQAKRYLTRPRNIFDIKYFVKKYLTKLYLVEARGYILLVVRYKRIDDDDDDGRSDETADFKVYVLCEKNKIWRRINTLGNFAFFIGNDSSMSIKVSSLPNFKRNCIYFTDDDTGLWRPYRDQHDEALGGNDMGYYNLKTKDFNKVRNGDRALCAYSAPLWLVPMF